MKAIMANFDFIDMKELSGVAIHLLEQEEVQAIEPVSNALTVLTSQGFMEEFD